MAWLNRPQQSIDDRINIMKGPVKLKLHLCREYIICPVLVVRGLSVF